MTVVTRPILLKDLPTRCKQLDSNSNNNNSRRRRPPNQDRVTPAPLVVAVLPHTEVAVDITLGTL